MPKQSISQLKQWFETADQPTQEQFWDWLDSFVHKDDNIAISKVTNLQIILNELANADSVLNILNQMLPIIVRDGVDTVTIPADTLVRGFCVIDVENLVFSVGTNIELKDYIEDAEISVGNEVIESSRYFKEATELFFIGITENTIIKILKG